MKQYGRASLRRCLAALFAALMVFSVLPLTAMAEGIEGLSDNTARAAVGGDAEALAIGGEERSNAATVYYKRAQSIDTSKQYLITTTDSSGTVYAMTSDYYDTNYSCQLVGASVETATINGETCVQDANISNKYLWTFSTTSGGTIKNAETNTYLAATSDYLVLSSSGATFSYNSNALSLSEGGDYPYIGFSSDYFSKYFDMSPSESAAPITLYERVVKAKSVEVNPPVHAMAPNATKQLTAVVYPTNATNKKVTWTSSNNDVATVDDTGHVTAVTVGEATITATTEDGGYTDTCVVTVTDNATKEVTMFVNTLHAVPNEDYLIGYTTTSDETYIMSNAVSNTSYLAAAGATLSTVGNVCGVADTTSCITALSDGSEIPTTHQWYFGADADLGYTTIQNRATNYYLQRAEGSGDPTYVGLSTEQNAATTGNQSCTRGTSSEDDVTFIYHYDSSSTAYHFVTFNTTYGDFRTYYNTTSTGYTVDLYVKRTVTVKDPASTEPGVTIEPAELTVLRNGGSGTLTATAVNIPESASYEWTSDKEPVATVASAAGNPSTATVTGVATGTATITCTVTYNEGDAQQTLTATATVNVVENYQVASITVPPEISLELDKGTVITPVVVTAPEGGEYGTDYTIEYVCDNANVADITTANGKVFTVTAKSIGTVTITFTAINSHNSTQRVSGSTVITVKEADSIPAPETGEGGGEKPIYKKVYVLVDDVGEADGNYIIATSNLPGAADAYALYDNGSSYVQRGKVNIQSGSYGIYIEPNDDSYVWGWNYESTNPTYGRCGAVWNIGTKRGLRATGNSSNNYLDATVDSSGYAVNWYSAPSSSAAHYITSPVYNNYSPNRYYLGYYSLNYPYRWYTSSYYNPTPGDQFYFYKEKIVQTGTESVDSGVEIYLDGEKISQKEKAIEGVVQGQKSSVTLTGTPVNIPAGATDKSAVWTLTKKDGAIKSVDSSGVVTLTGDLGYGIIEVTYTYRYGDKTYTVKNYTKLVVSSFKPMTGTGETVTQKYVYVLTDTLKAGEDYIIVYDKNSATNDAEPIVPGTVRYNGRYNETTAYTMVHLLLGDSVTVNAGTDATNNQPYIESDDARIVWRAVTADSKIALYNPDSNRYMAYDLQEIHSETYGSNLYYSAAALSSGLYMPITYTSNDASLKIGGKSLQCYEDYDADTYGLQMALESETAFSKFYLYKRTEIEMVDTAEVSVDIYDGSKLVSGGVVSVNDTSSTLPLTAQTNYNGTGQIAWSIISGENIASIDQNGVVTFTANTSGKVLVQVTFKFGNGQTQMATNYVTLDVRSGGQLTDTSDRDNFPEYPNEGSVRLEKTADADETEFAKTGVGTVELFVRGVPVRSKGVDVVLVVDTSGSMEDYLTGAEADKMSIAKAAAIKFANTLLTVTNPDGTISYTDNKLAVVSFADYASVLTGTSTLVADSRALVSVSSSSGMSSIETAINSMSATGGTNYDAAFKTAYDILRDAQEQGGDRKQYVVFVTDGAPGIYNNAELDSTTFPKAGTYYTTTEIETMSAQWYNWTQGVVPEWSSMPPAAAANFAKYAYADNIYAAAIKGTTFAGSNFKDSWKKDLDITAMLGAGIYGISLGMKGGSQIIGVTTNSSGAEDWAEFTSAQCTNLINRLCNKDIFAADSTEGLTAAFEKIGKEVLQAGTNATVRDTIGADYDLQIEPFNYIDNPRETGFEPSIEVRKYTVDANGNRTGAYETIEKVTFKAAGKEAYSTLKTGNIMTLDGENYTITAENFTYTSSDKRFVWKFDTIISDDMAIRFNVYLTGTREGSREGGLYDTNSWANLTYTNYLGTDCRLTFEKPALPWQNARVTYKFFLVDESGRPVNKDGALVNYANLTYVGTEKTIKLGDAAFVPMSGADGHYSVELKAADLKKLQSELSAYALYDVSAAVTIHTNTTGTWGGYSITKGNTLTATTAVWPKPGADAKFVDAADADGNFTNVTVAFAVVFKVKLIPDAVVIDFGLPVDINVMQNDLVSQVSGQLYGLTQDTDAKPDFASAYTPSDATVTTVGEKLNLTYGHATIRNDTTIRYTPGSMQMSQPEVFGYEVEVTGTSEADGTPTPKYISSTVTVIPATTIYYEDNFSNSDGTSYITYNDGVSEWKLVGEGVSGTVVQDTDYVGGGNNYGYDSHYNNCATFSLNQAHKVTVTKEQYDSIVSDPMKTWPTASFSFTGKGFDVISLTNAKTGMIMVQVKDKNGDIVRSVFVDTYYSGAVEVNGDLYQIPVINIYDLPHGTYDVTITVPYLEMFDHTGSDGQPGGSYDMYIDGIRIYNPAGGNAEAHGAHTEDDEAYPYVQELRNMMLTAANGGQLSGPVFVDGNAATLDASVYQSDGPNNEVYLASGQAIVFALQTVGTTKPAGVYVSMKSPTGEVKVRYGSAAEVVNESTGLKYEERNMVTTSDMYYEIPENVLIWEPQEDGTWKTKVAVQIANTSTPGQGQILALTNLKVTYASAPTDNNGENNGKVIFTTTQQQSQVAYTQIRDLMAELYADSYDTEIRSAAFATRTIDVNKTTELNVVTSTDANALIIRDKKGNVITPESISYEDKDGERHWKLTMTHKVSGIYIYKVSVEAAYGIMTETPATVVAYVVPRSVVRPKPSMPKPPLFGWM